MFLGVIALLFLECCSAILLTSWKLESSKNIVDIAETSKVGFNSTGWLQVSLPTTVLGALVQNGTYKNLYRGTNILSVDTKQFEVPWVFRSEFDSPIIGSPSVLRFEGISYKGVIYINGKMIEEVEGTFVYHDVVFQPEAKNAVSVAVTKANDLVFPPDNNSTDLSITWIDWAPSPPDASMGLIRPVLLLDCQNGALLQYPSLTTTLQNNGDAMVIVSVEVFNCGNQNLSTVLNLSLLEASAQVKVQVSVGQSSLISFPSVTLHNPPLWQPWQRGLATMVDLRIFSASGLSLDTKVGLRQVVSGVDNNGYRFYEINGEKLQIRGAGWANELLLQNQTQWTETYLKHAKDVGLNTIRLEGQLMGDEIFDFADANGMLIFPGISCCDAWQHWKSWTNDTYQVASKTLQSQIRRIRSHPSALAFWYSSDELPPMDVEQMFLNIFKQELWPNGLLASASNLTSKLSGRTGVKMSGPYVWVPPNYWLKATPNDKLKGGAFGFLSEGSPGEVPLTWESIQEAQELLWPPDNPDWMFHIANPVGYIGHNDFFTKPLNNRYGVSANAEEYCKKGQVQSYESYRAYMEAYNLNNASFVSWMLQSARPQHQWHLIEYNGLLPGAYFGAKSANKPIHVMLDETGSLAVYGDRTLGSLSFSATVYDINGTAIWDHSMSVVINGRSAKGIFPVNAFNSQIRFVELIASVERGQVDRNIYWLPSDTQNDVFDFSATSYYSSPFLAFANFTSLSTLPQPNLEWAEQHTDTYSTITIENAGSSVAFFIRVRLVNTKDGSDITPAIWSDNYITLFANQKQLILVEHAGSPDQNIKFVVEPFNM